MTEPDKNQHLSPILSDIQDFGPEDESGGETSPADEGQPFADGAAQREPQGSDPEQRAYLALAVVLVLVAGLSTGTAWYLQSQVSDLSRQLQQLQDQAARAEAGALPEHSHPANPDLALFRGKIDDLELRLAELSPERTAAPAQRGDHAGTIDAGDSPEAAGETNAPDESPVATAIAAADTDKPESAAQPPAAGSTDIPRVDPATPWFINLGSFEIEEVARRWSRSLEQPLRPLQVVQATSQGRRIYRVRMGGFVDRAEAEDWAKRLQEQWQLDATWVSDY